MKTVLIIVGVILAAVIIYFVYRSAYKPSSQTGSSTPVATTSVSLENIAFNPSNISVSVGQEVTFTNNDSVTHTITADDNSFNSGNVAKGQSYKHVFNKAGTYNFHCSVHPSMKGTVSVK